MKKEIDPCRLGLFVLSGAAIVVGGLIWIGATHLFQNTKTYVSFFDSSVRGLKTGSDVEYLGIHIGRVASVSLVQNDRRWVRVVMELEPTFEVKENQAVELKLAGLAGGKYLSVVDTPGNSRPSKPAGDISTKYPVTPSKSGTLAQIENALEDLYQKFQDIDIKKAVKSWAEVGQNANRILTNPDIDTVLHNLKQSSVALQNLMERIGGPEPASQIAKGIDNFAAASASFRRSGEGISRQVEALPPGEIADVVQKIQAVSGKTEQLAESLRNGLEQNFSLLHQSIRQINQVLAELEALVQSLREEPGRILRRPKESEPFRR